MNIEIIDLPESQVEELEANTIRLDTFSLQGKEFYQTMNYEQAGYYKNDMDNYEEYFFVKRI